MIKIVQVFGSLNAGGAESRTMDVFRAIDRSRYNFIFISLDSTQNQFFENEILNLGGEIYKLSSPREVGILRHLNELATLLKELHNKGTNVIHANTSYHSGIVLAVARIIGFSIRIAHARTTSSINKKTLPQRLMIGAGRTLIKIFATHRLALNDECAKYLFGDKAIKNHQVKIIPNAINLEKFKKFVNTSHGNFHDEIVLGHIGRFVEMKNHKFLVDFFKAFNEKNPNSKLILVGNGPLMPEIQTKVIELGLQDKVEFLGIRNDIPNILSRFSLFVLPSVFEGLSGVLLEAQACGVPCLVSDTVSRTTDMGLGIVQYLSLDEPKEKWGKTAMDLLSLRRPTSEEIFNAFDDRGFTLPHELNELYSIYGA